MPANTVPREMRHGALHKLMPMANTKFCPAETEIVSEICPN